MKLALCVGNNYPRTPNELQGCVNDANDWAEMLGQEGYDVSTTLEGGRVDVLDALQSMVGRLKWGSRLVFTYSGHGTWIPDRDGDETDGRDEALYMADGELILDDDLQHVFAGLPLGTGALILSDSCFSGTISRFMHPNAGVPKFVSPTTFLDMTDAQARAIEERTTSTPPRASASLISGCSENEYSYDAWFGSRPNGAFTRAAIDSFNSGVSLNTWYKSIRMLLPTPVFTQTPLLTPASTYRKYARAL